MSDLWKKRFLKLDYVPTQEKMLKENLQELSKYLDNVFFKDLQGKKLRAKTKSRKLATQWITSPVFLHGGNSNYQKDIINAIKQEISAEIIQEFIGGIKDIKAETIGYYEWYSCGDMNDENSPTSAINIIKRCFKQAKNDGATWAIISPMSLTLLQSFVSDFKRKQFHTYDTPSSFTFCGDYDGIRLFVDQYADDQRPIILGYPKSFTFSANKKIKIVETIIDPNTFEPAPLFTSDYCFSFDRSKFSLIKFDFCTLDGDGMSRISQW